MPGKKRKGSKKGGPASYNSGDAEQSNRRTNGRSPSLGGPLNLGARPFEFKTTKRIRPKKKKS